MRVILKNLSLTSITVLLGFAVMLLPGCTHQYYAPTSHNVPMLQQKGDFRVNGGFYTGEEAEGGELQTAFAPGQNVAVMINGSLINQSDYDGPDSDYGKGGYLEAGVGYFKPNEARHTVFETFGGFGSGAVRNGYGPDGSSNMNFNKFFVQSSLGYKRRFFEAGFSMRLGFLSFYNIRTTGTLGEPEMTNIAFIRSKDVITVIEPALTLRAGPPNFKFQVQHGRSFSLSGSDFAGVDPYLSIGVMFQFPRTTTGKQ